MASPRSDCTVPPTDEHSFSRRSPRLEQDERSHGTLPVDPSWFFTAPAQETPVMSPSPTTGLSGASNQATLMVSTAETSTRAASPPGPSPVAPVHDLSLQLACQRPGVSLEHPSYRERRASARARCCYAFSRSLWVARPPSAFRPHLPPRYDGGTPPLVFLQEYERSMLAAEGRDRCLMSYLPLELKGPALAWLTNLPDSSVGT